jgi:myosin heavy subunit
VDVPGLISREVSNLGAAWEVLQRASSVRSSGETKSNAHSSRSHCLLRVAVHGYNKLNKDEMNAKLWLVDLAGSERVGKSEATGARLKEAQFINRSLSSLGDCIYALATKSAHIPYRNSKLTHLLADSLGGDSKTVMIVNVSPNVSDIGETTCSLNFASRVRGVEMGPAKRHVESNMSEVQKAKMQVTDLKAQVEELQEGKVAQQKKLREAAAEQASMANQLKKKERAAARLERKVSRLQEKLGAVDEEEEVEEEEDADESINVGTLEQFLAPTASPVYKAAGSTAAAPLGGATGTTPEPHQQQSSSTPASTMHPSSLKMAQLAGQLGESLVIRASEADFEAGKPSPQEVVEIVVTQPKSETFVARFADYRQRPDRQEVDPLVAAAEAAEAEKMRKKKNGFGRKVKRWVGFW